MHTRKGERYDRRHQAARASWEPAVNTGRARCTEPVCLMPTREIMPGTPWDLAHDREHGGYHGPAHARCNRAEGARYGNRRRTEPRRLPRW